MPLLAQVLPTEEPPLIFDKALQELEQEGAINNQENLQLRQGVYPQRSAPAQQYVPNLEKLCSSGVLSQRECARTVYPTPKRKVQGMCSDLSTHQAEVNAAANPSIERLMALQRRKASLDACNIEKAEYDRRIQAERIAAMRRNRLNWKTYGDVQIPWGLWFEPLPGKRVNGFIGRSGIKHTTGFVENYGPTAAPSGISVSCSTGTFSINTNPNWNRLQSGWTEWAPPPKGSDWERIVIDLCSPVVNR